MALKPLISRLETPVAKEPAPESATGGILHLLRCGESITPLEALDRFGCLRLGSIIFHLRRTYGLPIVTKIVEHESGKRFAHYSLEK